MNFNQYTRKSLEAVQSAQTIARENSHQQMEQVHLLLALLQQDNGLAPQILRKLGVTVESLEAAARGELEKLPRVSGSREADKFYISQGVDEVFRQAERLAAGMKDEYVSVEHLLLALIEAAQGPVKELLGTYRITKEDCLQALQAIRGNQRVTSDSPEDTYEALEKYGTDLVRRAREQKMDPVIGRDEEIRNVIRILSRKTKNNPVLIGEPGVGKTAVFYQLAQELGINLVSYTMTHHTRQSALGLPLIREKTFGGKPYSATEYTMSEILASVYERMEQTGIRTGILFLDEINCVSETLMPAMLQLLQSKQFGTHRLPEGWVIAAAGNPPAYNESARSFDTVTIDRVRLLEISENYPVWRDYAHAKGLHPAVLSYLELNPEHFYRVERTARGRSFVTARGWEDLSQTLCSYERLGFAVTGALFGEFLQHAEIAASFEAFFRLYSGWREKLALAPILSGRQSGCAPELQELSFDGRLAAVEFLLHAVRRELEDYRQSAALCGSLESFVSALQQEADPLRAAKENLSRREKAVQLRQELGVLPPGEQARERHLAARLHALLDDADDLAALRQEAERCRQALLQQESSCSAQLDNAMGFVYDTFGAGHELLIFLTQLGRLPGAQAFLPGSARYRTLCRQTLPEELAKDL